MKASDILVVETCGDIQMGRPVVRCECGKYRDADNPHAYRRTAFEKWPATMRADETSEDMKVANAMADYTPRRSQ